MNNTIYTRVRENLPDYEDTTITYKGRMYRLSVEPDEYSAMDDERDWLGDFEQIQRGSQSERPDGFNGRARKLWDGDSFLWYQPPSHMKDEYIPQFVRNVVMPIITEGFQMLKVERLGKADYTGRYAVEDRECLGGCTYFDNSETTLAGMAEVLTDMVQGLDIAARKNAE